MSDLVSKEEVIKRIKEQYNKHNALIPHWLSIGDIPSVKQMSEKEDTAESDGDLITALSKLHTIESSDGQDYVQMYDVLETVKRNSAKKDTAETDGDLISRKKVLKEGAYYSNLPTHTFLKDVVKVLPSAEKIDGDLISRESVITMLNKIENAVEDGDGFQFDEWVEYAKDIPSAEKTTINGDLISRQAVKDLIRGLTKWSVRSQDRKFENVGLLYDDIMFGIDRLPSAEKTTLSEEKTTITDTDLISRTDLLKDIADLKKSPWFNDGKDIKDLFRHNSYVARKEAVEIIEDLCIKKLPSTEK